MVDLNTIFQAGMGVAGKKKKEKKKEVQEKIAPTPELEVPKEEIPKAPVPLSADQLRLMYVGSKGGTPEDLIREGFSGTLEEAQQVLNKKSLTKNLVPKTNVEIQEAQDITKSVGAFKETPSDFPEWSFYGILDRSPFGQAIEARKALNQLKGDVGSKTYSKMLDAIKTKGLTPQQVAPNDLVMQNLLSLELRDYDLEVLKSGDADVELLTQFVEAIPIIGGFTNKAGEAIIPTTALAKVKALQAEIVKIGGKMRSYRMTVARSPDLASSFLEKIDNSERELANAESRVKLLIIQSPVLQNAPEEVEIIFQDIDRAYTDITGARSGIIAEKVLSKY